MIILSFIFGVLGGLLGHLGGLGDDYWQKHQSLPRLLFNTKVRDMGIPILCVILAFLFGVHSWWLLLFFGATFGALTDYWKHPFGFTNMWFHGFMIGVASVFICITTGHWVAWAVRCVFLAVWMGLVHILRIKFPEEAIRYFIVPSTLFMIC